MPLIVDVCDTLIQNQHDKGWVVIATRILQLGCVGLMLSVTAAHADRTFYLSTKHLVAESDTVAVTHDHDVQEVEKPENAQIDTLWLDLNSTLRIVRKSDNVEISKQNVMPLTALTPVENGRYFAGLSHLMALSHQYNFILISADGQIVTTALITPSSPHCRSLSFSTTNFIRWFNLDAPEVRLSYAGDQLDAVIVKNPYDRDADGTEGECVIPVEAAGEGHDETS